MFDVRDCLKPAIEKSGMKQSAIASRVNLSMQQMSDIVNKRRRLDANELISICQVINVTPNDLLIYGLEERKPPAGRSA